MPKAGQSRFSSTPQVPMQLCRIELDGSVDLGQAEPHAALSDVIAATTDLYRRRGFVPPWICYVAVDSGQVVGSCGFAAPAEHAEAEVAYFTFPGHEGRGIATRMAASLMALSSDAARSKGVSFVAHTLPAEGASTSILRKLGFECLGSTQHPDDGEVWRWRRKGGEVDV